MDSRRHFLRGLARAASGGIRAIPPAETPAAVGEVPEGRPGRTGGAPEAPPALGAPSRYAVALADPRWGEAAQAALSRAQVLVVGAGSLGAPVLGYLAGAGVGRLGVLDDAEVALPDLAAETIHYTPDVGAAKAHSAAAKLGFLNSDIVVEPYQVRLDAGNAEGLLAGQDLVIDCSNDSETQALVAGTCARLAIALVSAAAAASGGWVLSVPAGEHACILCAGAWQQRTSDPGTGVAGVVGSLQAREALARLVSDDVAPASALRVDLDAPALRRSALTHRRDCPVCGPR